MRSRQGMPASGLPLSKVRQTFEDAALCGLTALFRSRDRILFPCGLIPLVLTSCIGFPVGGDVGQAKPFAQPEPLAQLFHYRA